MSRSRKTAPLVYSCSGCSDVAQLANEVAVRIDHAGVTPTEHVKLYEMGYRKRRGQRYDEAAIDQVCTDVTQLIARLPMQATADTEGKA